MSSMGIILISSKSKVMHHVENLLIHTNSNTITQRITHRSTANPTNQSHRLSLSYGIKGFRSITLTCSSSASTCFLSSAKACSRARWPLICALSTRGALVHLEPMSYVDGNAHAEGASPSSSPPVGRLVHDGGEDGSFIIERYLGLKLSIAPPNIYSKSNVVPFGHSHEDLLRR